MEISWSVSALSPWALALVGFFAANFLMVTAICLVALSRSHRRLRKLRSLQILTEEHLGSELFAAIRMRAQTEYLLIPFAALFFFLVTSALATLLAVLSEHAKLSDTLQQVALVAILPAYAFAVAKVYAVMESGQVRSATFLAATVDICFVSIVVICAWILIGQHASASGGRAVLGGALVVAVLWLNRAGIRRWARGFGRNRPGRSESSESRPNSLLRIEGLSSAGIAELNQRGIETVENLATSDPVLLFQQTSLEVMQVIDCIGQAQLRTRFPSMGPNGLERRLRNSGIRTILDLAPVIRVPNPPGIFESDDDAIASSWEEWQHVATLLEKDPAFKALADLSAAVSDRSVNLADRFRKAPEQLNVIVRDALPAAVRSDPLTVYEGWLAVDATAVTSDSGGKARKVRVHISTQEIRNLAHCTRVTIEDGEPHETVRFQVRIDVRRGENQIDLPRSKWVTVPTRDGGETVDFELDAAPPIETLRAMLLQAGKTVQVLEVALSPGPSLELPWKARQ